MTPDVIVCWPRSCDYPLWRKWLADERGWFDQVFVVFTDHDGDDISDFVRGQLKDVTFLDSHAIGDWRDTAINMALEQSKAEWVWFTEQDFSINLAGLFWATVDALATRNDVIGWYDTNGRLHPSCLFARRNAIEHTSRYFGTPPVDHFYAFTKELESQASIADFSQRLPRPDAWDHMAGVSQNHALLSRNEDGGIYKRTAFRGYLRRCLESGVALEPGWEAIARREVGA